MAYASSSRHLPRESIYPQPPSSDFLNALEDCVQATELCSATLQRGLGKLELGTSDLPRLTKIMRHKHHFLVLPEPTILAHKSALATSLAPQIDQLIVRAEGAVESEKAKVANLEERLHLLELARRPAASTTPSSPSGPAANSLDDARPRAADTTCKITDVNMRELSILQRKKIMMMKIKREKLEKELARLTED